MRKTTINSKTTVEEIAAMVSSALTEAGIQAVLSGGAVVSIYSDNEYQSQDLDFVTSATIKELTQVMAQLGFTRGSKGRYFTHQGTEYFVEFPPSPLAIGDQPVKKWNQLETRKGIIQILTPTQCVMDRLAGFYHWNDLQNLDQAVMVACKQGVNLSLVKKWSAQEEAIDKYDLFLAAYSKKKGQLKGE